MKPKLGNSRKLGKLGKSLESALYYEQKLLYSDTSPKVNMRHVAGSPETSGHLYLKPYRTGYRLFYTALFTDSVLSIKYATASGKVSCMCGSSNARTRAW